MAGFQPLPGFRDFYPEDFARRQHIYTVWRRAAMAHGFQEYDAPVLEPLELYTTKSGEEIEGQLFNFIDKGERAVSLRPEMTPSVCRMVGAKAGSLKRPIKWFSIAEFYRYERAQKGRLRAFSQLNADIFGESGPEAEIELIALLIQCLAGFGLTPDDFYVRLSDRNLWFYYLEALGFSEVQVRDLLGAIDRHEKMGDEAFKAYNDKHGPLDPVAKIKIVSFLGVKSLLSLETALTSLQNEKITARLVDWGKLLDGLAAMGLAEFIQVDLGVVRGLAYYTGFVFEAFDRQGGLRALAGGGRYDNLVGKLGYAELPAVGFAIGDVTTGLLLEQHGKSAPASPGPDVFVVLGGEVEKRIAFADIQSLRAAGWRVEYPLRDAAFGKQFKTAAESGARLALIYGADEMAKGVVKIRNLIDRTERDVPRGQLSAAVRDSLATK